MTVLVTGFGPFLSVSDNPSGRLARAVDGREVRGHRIVGRVLPVSYERGPAEAVALAAHHRASLVIGLGVAARAVRPRVERWGLRVCAADHPDVDGVCLEGLDGPARVEATLDVACLAQALDAEISEDAGAYVCNAWLHGVAARLDVPVGFVHIPPGPVDADWLVAGIDALLTPRSGSAAD